MLFKKRNYPIQFFSISLSMVYHFFLFRLFQNRLFCCMYFIWKCLITWNWTIDNLWKTNAKIKIQNTILKKRHHLYRVVFARGVALYIQTNEQRSILRGYGRAMFFTSFQKAGKVSLYVLQASCSGEGAWYRELN